MADYSKLMNLEKKKQPISSPVVHKESQQLPVTEEQPSSHPQRSISQPTNQPIIQSTDQSINRLTNQSENQIVEKPKAFYITKRLDYRLDTAVRYIQERHRIKKVDRSILVNAIMDTDALWTEQHLDLLIDRVMDLLTSRLMK